MTHYPDAPGYQATDTSIAAARSAEPTAPLLRDRVLAAISAAGGHGMTADECAAKIGETPFSARPRITELKIKGKIVDSGTRRANPSGRRAAVFVAAQ